MTKQETMVRLIIVCKQVEGKLKDLESLKSEIKHNKALIRDQMSIYGLTVQELRFEAGLPMKWLEEVQI